jgi:succinoglycan biosynthesis protein ExoA
MSLGKKPVVSIIMPVRNEARYIGRSLESVLKQDYPPELMKILIVDGISSDSTREIVNQVIDRQKQEVDGKIPSIALLDNPGHTVPIALNIGLRNSRGDVIIRVDGHCEIPSNYVRRCVELLKKTKANNVGGITYSIGETYISRAIAEAMRSPFVIGNSRFRYSSKPGYVETVFPGAWPREIFDRIGKFDERLIRHQDYEFNVRLRNAGGQIYFSPELKIRYYSRANFVSLAKQYFQYGYWKAQVSKESPDAFRIRHFAPVLLTLAAFTGAVISPLWVGFRIAYLGLWMLYGLFCLGTSAYSAIRNGWKYLPVLPFIYPAIHLSWGAGFWSGLLQSGLKFSKSRKHEGNNS